MSKIICVVDKDVLEGKSLLGEHGLAFWIEMQNGNVLFDTAQTEAVLLNNLESLCLSPQNIDTIVLSHAHYDHTGGLEAILKQKISPILYAHPDIFRPRYALRNGEYQSIGIKIDQPKLTALAGLKLSDYPDEIFPGLWTTGEILKRPEPQGSSTHLFVKTEKSWSPDVYRDDMSLVLKTAAGIVLICGCCHAGILNTLFHITRIFSDPVIAIIGGIHLVQADDQYLDHLICVIRDQYPELVFYLNHCTGEKAISKLSAAFGDRVHNCPAGTVIQFDNL